MANVKRYKKTIPLESTWLGIFAFERLDSDDDCKHLVDEFYNYNINNPTLRKHAFEQIALPYFTSLDEFNKAGLKQNLAEALTFSNKELFQVFKDSGMVFMTTVEDPHEFLVNLWNVVFPNEPSNKL